MATSTALAYRQVFNSIDNSGNGPGQQWNHVLWELYHYFFTTAEAVDSGRWTVVDSNLSTLQWANAVNVVDNSWFVVAAAKGRHGGNSNVQFKFQATNVAALNEAPVGTYRVIASMVSNAVWTGKGNPNGGWAAGVTLFTGNLLIAGNNITGNPAGSMVVHGDRETVLVAGTLSGQDAFAWGCYIGRFDTETDRVTYPECLLTAWDGVGAPKGFDRSVGGAFAPTPGSSAMLDENLAITTCNVWTSGWMDAAHEPSLFSGEYHYRPLELTTTNCYVGTLRMVWSCANLGARSRMDTRQKLVLHDVALTSGVTIQHNGLDLP